MTPLFRAQCATCGKEFRKTTEYGAAAALRLHDARSHSGKIKSATQLPPGHYPCPFCSKVCGYPQVLGRHISYAHKGETKPVLKPVLTPAPPPEPPKIVPLQPIVTAHERKARVFWTDEEYEQVIQHAAELRLQDHELELLKIFHQAQEVLPTHRHRNIVGWINLRDGIKEQVLMRVAALVKQKVDDAVASVPPDIKEIPTLVEQQVDPLKFLQALPTGALIAECIVRLCSRLDSLERALITHKNGTTTEAPRPMVATAHAAPIMKRKPRIAIVGLFKDQFERVKEKLSDQDVDLIYYNKDQHDLQFPPVDQIIIQKHSSHRVWDKAKASGNRVVFVDGGHTAVARMCFDFLSRRNGITATATTNGH